MTEKEIVLKAINSIKIEPLHKKLCLSFDKGGYEWPEEEALEAIESYKQFLLEIALNKINNGPPNRIVDIVWHTHILFTRMYHEDCQKIFGHYLHHTPKLE